MFQVVYAGQAQSNHRKLSAAVIKAYSYPSRKDVDVIYICKHQGHSGHSALQGDEFSSIDSMGLDWYKAMQQRRDNLKKNTYEIL